jgi:hypothetical protein
MFPKNPTKLGKPGKKSETKGKHGHNKLQNLLFGKIFFDEKKLIY